MVFGGSEAVFEWMGCMRFGYHRPACLRLPRRGALHLLLVGVRAHQTRRCAPGLGWGFWFSRTPAQCRLRGECGAQSLGQCRGSGPAWPIDSPSHSSNSPEHWEPSRATDCLPLIDEIYHAADNTCYHLRHAVLVLRLRRAVPRATRPRLHSLTHIFS